MSQPPRVAGADRSRDAYIPSLGDEGSLSGASTSALGHFCCASTHTHNPPQTSCGCVRGSPPHQARRGAASTGPGRTMVAVVCVYVVCNETRSVRVQMGSGHGSRIRAVRRGGSMMDAWSWWVRGGEQLRWEDGTDGGGGEGRTMAFKAGDR